jgi:hypothetical protein
MKLEIPLNIIIEISNLDSPFFTLDQQEELKNSLIANINYLFEDSEYLSDVIQDQISPYSFKSISVSD